MNEDAWEKLDTWERRDHELIKDHLNEAPVKLENDNWKLRMNNPEIMAFGESNWTDSWICTGWIKELSWSKQLWEDGNKLESRILKRMEQHMEEKFFFGLQVWRIAKRNTTMNSWYTPRWRIERLSQRGQKFVSDIGEGNWLMLIPSYVKLGKEFESNNRKD